jgi:hypothetical protein
MFQITGRDCFPDAAEGTRSDGGTTSQFFRGRESVSVAEIRQA